GDAHPARPRPGEGAALAAQLRLVARLQARLVARGDGEGEPAVAVGQLGTPPRALGPGRGEQPVEATHRDGALLPFVGAGGPTGPPAPPVMRVLGVAAACSARPTRGTASTASTRRRGAASGRWRSWGRGWAGGRCWSWAAATARPSS